MSEHRLDRTLRTSDKQFPFCCLSISGDHAPCFGGVRCGLVPEVDGHNRGMTFGTLCVSKEARVGFQQMNVRRGQPRQPEQRLWQLRATRRCRTAASARCWVRAAVGHRAPGRGSKRIYRVPHKGIDLLRVISGIMVCSVEGDPDSQDPLLMMTAALSFFYFLTIFAVGLVGSRRGLQ